MIQKYYVLTKFVSENNKFEHDKKEVNDSPIEFM